MANRVKEDQKHERVIRGLLKLSENRRCINCNSLGPQYVCTNFWTFVCTTCSGIHREFTHRVKSVSMAKFTSQEVSALQGGGNACAKQIYFKEWDSHCLSVPDSRNVERLRDFIKHVYVDRRYTGERNFDKPPRVKIGETEESYENRRTDACQGGSRSPPYEDMYDRHYSNRPSPGGRSDEKNYKSSCDERRSPGYDQENQHYNDNRDSGHASIVNDWRLEDRFGNVRRSDEFRISDSKLDGRSPDHQKDIDMSSPPMVRPVRDILRDNAYPFPIIDPPKANGATGAEGSARTQRTASSSSLTSSNGNLAELRRENSGILIDFDSFTEHPVNGAVPQTRQTATDVQPTSSNADNWACFDSITEVKEPQASTNANPLESVLSQLSVPASVPFTSSSLVSHLGYVSASPFGSTAPSVATINNFTTIPPHVAPAVVPAGHTSISSFGVGASPVAQATTFPPAAALGSASVLTVNGANSSVKVGDRAQWPGIYPQQHSSFPATGSQPTAQSSTLPFGGASSNQDLFAATYSPVSPPVPGWQIGPSHGLGFTMPYNATLHMPTFPQSSKSTNPFDLNNETLPVQAPTFFSMASLQSALPNMAASSGLLCASSLNTPSSTWMTPQSSFPSAMPPQAPSHALMISSSAYMGQQVPNNMPLRQQGVVGFGSEGAAFGSLNSNQHLGPATQNTFSSVGGNPFG